MAKYQKLDYLEAGWKKSYLLKRHRQGDWISLHQDLQLHELAIQTLEFSVPTPEEMEAWLRAHLAPRFLQQLHQAIRARRKRHFCAEESLRARKTVDLTYQAWKSLSDYAQLSELTLSQAIQALLAFKEAHARPYGVDFHGEALSSEESPPQSSEKE